MFPYFIMVCFPAYIFLLFYFFEKKQTDFMGNRFSSEKNYKYKIVINAFFAIWLTLLLFRSESVGIDLSVYKYHFNNYSQMSWEYLLSSDILIKREPGYFLLCKIVSLFSNNFRWIMVISALIAVLPIWKLYRDYGENGFLVVVLFLNIAPFVMYFSGLRQTIAMAFVVPCYYFCKKKDIVKFLLMILLAYQFHKSSIVILLMYPIYHIQWKKKIHLLYLLPVTAIIYVFKIPIFKFLLMFMNDKYIDRYSEGIRSTGAYAVLLLLIVLLIYSFLIIDQEKLDSETMGMRNFLVLSVILQVFSGVHSIAMRINYYYLLFVPLLIDRVIQSGNQQEKKILQLSKVCMVTFFTIYYFYYAYTDTDILNVYPYIPFWEDM